LLVGDAEGNVYIYLNTNDNFNPILDKGTIVIKANGLSGNSRAAPIVDDWNADGRKDLLVGYMDGKIKIYLNEGTDSSPVFNSFTYLRVGGKEFDIGSRSAPRIFDWNKDGKKDLLIGELEGYVYYLENIGTNDSPLFDRTKKLLLIDGSPLKANSDIDPESNPRSRLFVTDWNEDGRLDMIVGRADGKLELYMTKY
jgi:hypothetical protein